MGLAAPLLRRGAVTRLQTLRSQENRAEIAASTPPQPATSSDWRQAVPTLTGRLVALRELELGDAESLHALLSSDEVARFISPAPRDVRGFERFIEWMQHKRQQGTYVCYAVVPHGSSTAVGLFQIRAVDPGFGTAEWGFALASPYWGSGIFRDAADLTLRFIFETLGVHRLEARAAVLNGRGNGALRKLGAVQEAVLRGGLLRDKGAVDQVLWSILDTEWRQAKAVWISNVRVH
jgi:[ribosomal protein S5]-alanine N-acetyltransferase